MPRFKARVAVTEALKEKVSSLLFCTVLAGNKMLIDCMHVLIHKFVLIYVVSHIKDPWM